jgi:hypothetical protein
MESEKEVEENNLAEGWREIYYQMRVPQPEYDPNSKNKEKIISKVPELACLLPTVAVELTTNTGWKYCGRDFKLGVAEEIPKCPADKFYCCEFEYNKIMNGENLDKRVIM